MNMVDHGYNVASARQNVNYHSNKYADRPHLSPTKAHSPAPAADHRQHHHGGRGMNYGSYGDSYHTETKVGPDGAIYYYHYYH